MTLGAGLEFVKHDVEWGVVENKVDLVFVVLTNHGQRGVVIRIDKHEVLNEKHVDDVLAVAVVNWNPGEVK